MAPQSPTEEDGRKYRSKKQRPCDLCRSRKTHCRILGRDGPCELCKKLGRQCTFVCQPLRRVYDPKTNNDSLRGTGQPQPTEAPTLDGRATEPGLNRTPAPVHGHDIETTGEEAPFWLQQVDHSQSFNPRAASRLMSMDWSAMDFDSMDMVNTESHPEHEVLNNTLHEGDDLLHPTATHSLPAMTPRESPNSSNETESSRDSAPRDQARELYPEGGGESSPNRPWLPLDIQDKFPLNAADWPAKFSLDARKGYSNQLIGLSCESDPYLLRSYYYDQYDTYPMFRLDFRKVKDDATIQPFLDHCPTGSSRPPADYLPVQFVMTDEDIWKDSLRSVEGIQSGSNNEEGDFELLNKAVSADLGSRLLRLYTKFVHPRFPVLSLSDLACMPYAECDLLYPVGIQSAVYALAAPFTFLDDELSVLKGYGQVPTDELWAIAHRSYQRASCLSHLSSLQLCLLLLQRPPPNFAVAEPLSTWALSCSALSIAESLGLNLDPIDWRLPRNEMILRRRLWWFTYTQHVWFALVIARPSHINDGNWDVSALTQDDFEGDSIQDPEIRALVQTQIPLCLAECELGIIAADVLQELYTLKAVRQCSSLSALLSRAQPLRTRIERWRQTLPLLSKPASELSEEEFDGGAALRLAHLTLETLIFRALLRPLFFQALSTEEAHREPVSTIFENCHTCAKAGVEIVSALRAKHFTSFWHPYVRYQLCYISGFILLKFTHSPDRESAIQTRALLGRWRDTLRTQSRAWPLARLATIRLDAAFWKGLARVVHGAGPASPAVMLIKEQEQSASRDIQERPYSRAGMQ
ncbi:hypothetical protein GQ53DRAFT_728289 [Thozetella sp. PMI_491]|nr:hypothetical protein GQ53DRAFT_728289 [Thozetella sp. PMI_491]